MSFVHARTFETRWGLALAYIDLDDETDAEVLKLRVWAAVGDDGSDGKVEMKIGLNAGASDEAFDALAAANRSALVEMTAERFEAVVDKAGVGAMLDSLT